MKKYVEGVMNLKNLYREISKSLGCGVLALMMLGMPIASTINMQSIKVVHAAEIKSSYIKEFVYNTATIVEGEKYTLPSMLTAKMSDGTRKYVPVKWETTVDTSVAGNHTIYGKLDGFTEKGKFILNVLNKGEIKEIIYNKIDVKQGQDYKLPSTVTAKMKDGSRRYVPVKWETPANTSKIGKQVITGILPNYNNQKVTYTVNVKATNTNNSEYISKFLYNTITLKQGQSYSLPSTVTAILGNGKRVYVPVTWSNKLDVNRVGTQIIKGFTNGYNNKEVSFTVVIKANSSNTIEKFLYTSATIKGGQKYTLPSTVTAVMKDGSRKYVSVKWDRQPDVNRVGKQQITGVVDGYAVRVVFTLTVTQNASIKPGIDIIKKEEELTKAVFEEFNKFRVANGRQALPWDETCADWADKQTKKNASGEGSGHSIDMGWEYGNVVLMRSKDWGGHMTTPKEFIDQFSWSTDHRANMLQEDHTYAGCSVWSGKDDTYHLTIVFK